MSTEGSVVSECSKLPECMICMYPAALSIQLCKNWQCIARVCVFCVFDTWRMSCPIQIPKCVCGQYIAIPHDKQKLTKRIDLSSVQVWTRQLDHISCPRAGCHFQNQTFHNATEYISHVLTVHCPVRCDYCLKYDPKCCQCQSKHRLRHYPQNHIRCFSTKLPPVPPLFKCPNVEMLLRTQFTDID